MKSEKLTEADIRLIGEGQQLRALILEDSADIEEFLKKHNIPLTVKSVESYLGKNIPHSERFKGYMMGALGKSYRELVKDRLEQLSDYIDSINDNIERYYDKKKDVKLINKLLGLVNKEEEYTYNLRARLYRAKGMIYFFCNDITAAIELIETARSMAGDRMEHDLYVMCSADMATIYNYMERQYEAVPFCMEAERLIDSVRVRAETKYYYYRIYGNVFFRMPNYKRAIFMYEEALKHTQIDSAKARLYMGIGGVYCATGDFHSALELYDMANQSYDKSDIIGKSHVYNNKAEVFKRIGKFDEAEMWVVMALSIVDGKSDMQTIICTFTYIELKMQKGDIDAIDDIFKMLKSINKVYVYKSNIIEGLKAILKVCSSDIKYLQRLEARLYDYVKSLKVTENNSTFIKDVDSCYADVLRLLNKLQRKRKGV